MSEMYAEMNLDTYLRMCSTPDPRRPDQISMILPPDEAEMWRATTPSRLWGVPVSLCTPSDFQHVQELVSQHSIPIDDDYHITTLVPPELWPESIRRDVARRNHR